MTATRQQLVKNEDKVMLRGDSRLYVRNASEPIDPENLIPMEDLSKSPSLSVFQQNDRDLMRAYSRSESNVVPGTASLHKLETVSNDFISDPAFFRGQKSDFSSHTNSGNSILNPPFKSEQLDIKGLIDVSAFNFLRKQFMNFSFLFYKCAYFHMYYFPPQHYLSLFGKSKVGIQVAIKGTTFVNGNKVGTIYDETNDNGEHLERQCDENSNSNKNLTNRQEKCSNSNKNGDKRSAEHKHKIDVRNVIDPKTIHFLNFAKGCSIPSQQAFQRANTRKFFRNTFKKQWMASQEGSDVLHGSSAKKAAIGHSKKGFYLYSVLLVPDRLRFGDEQYAQHIAASVLKINSLDWDKDLRSKVTKANNAVPVAFLNEKLSKAGIDCRVFKRKGGDVHVT